MRLKRRSFAGSKAIAERSFVLPLRACGKPCGPRPGQNPAMTTSTPGRSRFPSSERVRGYAARLAGKNLKSDGVEDQARSALRKRFYAYASEELARGYVIDESDRFDASFPRPFSNTDELRETALYDESVYPVTRAEDGACVMHAWSGCPGASGYAEVGSLRRRGALRRVSHVRSMRFHACERWKHRRRLNFDRQRVRAPLTARWSKLPKEYERAREQPRSCDLGGEGDGGRLDGGMRQSRRRRQGLANRRKPSGRYGAVAPSSMPGGCRRMWIRLVLRPGRSCPRRAPRCLPRRLSRTTPKARLRFSRLFSTGSGRMRGLRSARAGSCSDAGPPCFRAFCDGQEALGEAVRSTLDQLPSRARAAWALGPRSVWKTSWRAWGLQPAELVSLKPVLVNSGHVVSSGRIRSPFHSPRPRRAHCPFRRRRRICSPRWSTMWRKRRFLWLKGSRTVSSLRG